MSTLVGIRRIYANVGAFTLFVIGTDKALRKLVEHANQLDGPAPRIPGHDPLRPRYAPPDPPRRRIVRDGLLTLSRRFR